ncbi:hypothetical protein FSHL1_006401 [Fusarium sambucinum]
MENNEAIRSVGEANHPFNPSNLWAKAYYNIHENKEYSVFLDEFETHLQQENDNQIEPGSVTTSALPGGLARLEDIQRLAKKQIEVVEEARTSFSVRGKRIVVREVVQKAIQHVAKFKPIISGAVSTEPHAALAWACVLGVLPILESVFQQDEDAADGFNNIVFIMVRYQHLLQTVVLRDFTNSSQDENVGQLFSNMETQLVSFYEQIYLYQIQFVRQYQKSKWRRNMGNMFNPKEWKEKWNTINSTRELIDESIRDRVSARILDSWETMSSIEKGTESVLKTVEDIQDGQKAAREWELLQSLQTASNATFDSSDVQGAQNSCLEGTQHSILDAIGDWVDSHTGELIFWLHGMAGTGKSSIALTVSSALKDGKSITADNLSPKNATLGASFFFKQGDATRNSIRSFFPTLVKDLADVSPNLKTLITTAIENNPSITAKAPLQQLQHLIVSPLSILDEKSFLPIHLIVVVDALDECINRREAEDLIRMLSEQLKSLRRVQLRLLVTSRSERHLFRAFKELPQDLFRSVVLDKIKPCVALDGRRDDITFYFEKTLAAIANRHGVDPSVITEATINHLSQKSDGLFIYAATTCRFLDTEDFDDDEARQERLELVLENGADNDDTTTDDSELDEWEANSPQNHVDDIYCKVLSFPDREQMSSAMKKKTYKEMGTVFGFLVIFSEPVSISSLKVFLPRSSKNLDKLLNKVRAIVAVPLDEELPLKVIHLSFRDFILSKKRSKRLKFHVEENEMHERVLERCLDIMSSQLRQDICNLVSSGTLDSEIPHNRLEANIPRYLRYACKYWRVEEIYVFLQGHFLHWLEVMSIMNEGPAAVLIINKLVTLTEDSRSPELSSLAYDMKRFILINRWIIDYAPLQIYVSAVIFSPVNSTIRPLLDPYMPSWIERRPDVGSHWSNELCALEGHTDLVMVLSFSPTGDLLLSSSLDGTTRLWDCVTGTERFQFEDRLMVDSASFSSDGKFIALGTSQGPIAVREVSSGCTVQLQSHESSVVLAIFSPQDNNILVSNSNDKTVKIWEINGNYVKYTMSTPDRLVASIQFTENGDFLILPQSDGITIWNVNTGQCTQRLNETFTTVFDEIAIPMDIHRILTVGHVSDKLGSLKGSGSDDQWEVKVVARSTGATTLRYLYNEDLNLVSATPLDRDSILISTSSGSIERLGMESWSQDRQFYTTLDDFGCTLSCDGSLMASASLNYSVKLWDTRLNAVRSEYSNTFTSRIERIYISPDLSFVAVPDNQGLIQVYDSTGSRFSLPVDNVRQIDFLPDGGYVLLETKSSFQLWDYSMTKLLLTSKDIKISSSGTFMATTDTIGGIKIFNTSSLYEIMMGHNIEQFAFSSHDDMAHIRYMDQESGIYFFELWDLPSEQRLWCKPSKDRAILRYHKFSPDKNVFAYISKSWSTDRALSYNMLYLKTGKEESIGEWDELVFHPNSHVFAMMSGQPRHIEIRDTNSLKLIHKFAFPCIWNQGYDIVYMAFSPGGRFAASSQADSECTVRFWDIGSGSQIGKYTVAGTISDLSMPDDRYFVCRQGRLPVPSSVPKDEGEEAKEDMKDLLYVGSQWISVD